jgi:RNA polymerase sigma-70 factor (ECF subfamily)
MDAVWTQAVHATLAVTGEAQGRRPVEESEFLALYRETAPALRGYLLRCARDPSVADDLTQEAFLRFLRSGFWHPGLAERRAYLYRIATNLVRDRHRRRRPEEPVDESNAGSVPAPSGLRRDVSRVFAQLRLKDRQLLWLADVEQLSHREIAEVLSLREPSVRTILFRARQRFAALLRTQGLAPLEARA